ncbi:metal ABC transporter ATP-binding protein [Halanaerobium hydrogeniformans]|uniref:ABC transporter related protein n=1 Tax=Halanaerobium hydrogeniformans TaxID=656519 RepID=E4RNS5_HALHG|nr:metal ABC transporter ATP-binding protein [Halanaerobium hydrogeniformans]ADQ13753.1 ABC transporter related protein [Halanaerobium hydrogeniformans]
MKVLEINNVSFSYEQEEVIKDITLSFAKSDFAAFVGPNGSGKSTLIKMITGNLKPDQGDIKIFGKSITNYSDWSRIGYISQQVRDFNQSFPATVREIIASNLYNKMGFIKIMNSELETKINKALKLVDMENYLNRKIGNLSGGQQQRVFIARMMVNDPDLILLDEPLVGVDIRAQDDFYQIIGEINDNLEKTVIMVSHDVNLISKQANKVICFDNGEAYSHDSSDFSYQNYIEGLRDTSIRIIPEHGH